MNLFKKKERTEVIRYIITGDIENTKGGNIERTVYKFDYYINAKIFIDKEAERLIEKKTINNQKLFKLKKSILLENWSYCKLLESEQLDTTIVYFIITKENKTIIKRQVN